MGIVERLRTEQPSYVLIAKAAIEIERLRDELIKYKAGYEGAAEAAFILNGKVERLREALEELLNVIPKFPSDGDFSVGTVRMKERYNQALIEASAALKRGGE